MQTKKIHQLEIILVGIQERTSSLLELNPLTAKIPATLQKYFYGGLAQKIPQRLTPGRTFCAYVDYASDEHGDYTYFVGEAVSGIDNPLPEGLSHYIIPEQTYTCFTTNPGAFPAVVINAWKSIWQMSSQELGGARSYQADFEVYDQRAINPLASVVDLYVGITPS